jgi:hypothetical protein
MSSVVTSRGRDRRAGRVDRHPAGDREQPRPQGLDLRGQQVHVTPGPYHRLLQQVLGGVAFAHGEAQQEAQQRRGVRVVDLLHARGLLGRRRAIDGGLPCVVRERVRLYHGRDVDQSGHESASPSESCRAQGSPVGMRKTSVNV